MAPEVQYDVADAGAEQPRRRLPRRLDQRARPADPAHAREDGFAYTPSGPGSASMRSTMRGSTGVVAA